MYELKGKSIKKLSCYLVIPEGFSKVQSGDQTKDT